MLEPSLPHDETSRLKSLRSLRILDTLAEQRFDRITRMTQRMFGVDICLISLIDSDRQWFKSKQGLAVCETPRAVSFCGHTILNDELLIVNDATKDVRFEDNPLVIAEPHIRFYAGCPIHDPNGFHIGTLCIIHGAPREMSDLDIENLRDLAGMVEGEVKVSSQVTIDELTEVANRRGFHMVASHMLSLCRRTATPAELIFFDLDRFKVINDTYGHAEGDKLLKYFADLLNKCFRTADAIGRLGGDEFVVLMGGSTQSAELALMRLREMSAKSDYYIGQKLAWSVGSIQFDPNRHDTIEHLLADADSSMYDDKVRRRIALAG